MFSFVRSILFMLNRSLHGLLF